MKALILSIEGRNAIVLLHGGEMRTVRARSGWSVGQEIDLHQIAAWKPSEGMAARVFVPLAACAAVLVLLFAGIYRLGGENIDRVHQSLSSGSMAAESTPEPSELPEIVPTQTQMPQPTPTAVPAAASDVPMQTPYEEGEICDECGQRGHDDDDCPHQICDECGQRGHDDDDCPNQVCDECGQRGHDDDDCPYESDDDDD